MCESVLYKCEKLDINDAFKFEDDLDPKVYDRLNDEETIENIKDYYDIWQTYLKALLNSVSRTLIKEIWRVAPYIVPDSYQHNIMLNNSSESYAKKMDYSRIISHFKKALSYSLEDNDQNDLDKLILSYIAKKEAIQNSENQPVSSEKDQDLDSIKLSDGRIYHPDDVKDPVIRRGKAFNEENNKIGSYRKQPEYLENVDGEDSEASVHRRKCGLCHQTGHYAPRCPNRENVQM
ncbi:13697_t:CDS:2 [Racocetra fulgida]|uniref:13697_t:CDS:1 n=1 Tax=Racocetra fulgida TaxID=60492 RepID=A0A9N9FUJ4_9GLOM|nr:13697_t:CDS:2 [Racocetra fulgida]